VRAQASATIIAIPTTVIISTIIGSFSAAHGIGSKGVEWNILRNLVALHDSAHLFFLALHVMAIATVSGSDPAAVFLIKRPLRLWRQHATVIAPSVTPAVIVIAVAVVVVLPLICSRLELRSLFRALRLRHSRKAECHYPE